MFLFKILVRHIIFFHKNNSSYLCTEFDKFLQFYKLSIINFLCVVEIVTFCFVFVFCIQRTFTAETLFQTGRVHPDFGHLARRHLSHYRHVLKNNTNSILPHKGMMLTVLQGPEYPPYLRSILWKKNYGPFPASFSLFLSFQYSWQ